MNLTHKTFDAAIKRAHKLAAQGPRVAAILTDGVLYGAVPGYLDSDTEKFKQVGLVTPDGRVWQPRESRKAGA